MNLQSVAKQIQNLRKTKGMTQNELGERLGVTFQAVSKWERGETLPDIALLPDLANILETSIDNILIGGERMINFKRKSSIKEITQAIESIAKLGELFGNDNSFYIGAIEGINAKMNIDFLEYYNEPYTKEGLIAEAVVQSIKNGVYFDLTDVRKNFSNSHWVDIIINFAAKYGIK